MKLIKNYKEIDAKYEAVIEIESGLVERKKQLVAQLKECDEYLKQTETKKEVYKNLKDTFHQQRNQWTVAAASLNVLITSKSGFCEKYEKITQEADQCLKDMKKVMDVEYRLPPFILADPSSWVIVKRMMAKHEVKKSKVAKTLIQIQESDDINCYYDFALIGSDVLFPTSEKPYHVIRLNKEGEVVGRYYPKNTQKPVLGVDVYDNDIYMLQWNTITVIPEREEENITYNINRRNMSKVLVQNKTTIFVSQIENPGGIFKYDTETGNTEILVEGLNRPTFISRMYKQDGYRYIVSEQGKHCIKVYDDSWELLNSFGGEGSTDGLFNVPAGTDITERGTVLVADINNHRISHYSLDLMLLLKMMVSSCL